MLDLMLFMYMCDHNQASLFVAIRQKSVIISEKGLSLKLPPIAPPATATHQSY